MPRFVEVPRQRNSREENSEIKQGTVPESFEQNENRMGTERCGGPLGKEGRGSAWRGQESCEGEPTTKLIEDDDVTDARVYDRPVGEDLPEAHI